MTSIEGAEIYGATNITINLYSIRVAVSCTTSAWKRINKVSVCVWVRERGRASSPRSSDSKLGAKTKQPHSSRNEVSKNRFSLFRFLLFLVLWLLATLVEHTRSKIKTSQALRTGLIAFVARKILTWERKSKMFGSCFVEDWKLLTKENEENQLATCAMTRRV